MSKIDCPFCGNQHESTETDLTVHFATYLEGLSYARGKTYLPPGGEIDPETVYKALKNYARDSGTDIKGLLKAMEEGWTE